MKFKRIMFVLLITIMLSGFYAIKDVKALDFADWSGNWFTVKISETGKAGPVVSVLDPDGGKLVTNNEKTFDAYLKIVEFTPGETTFFAVGFCTFDGSVWTTQSGPDMTWPVIGGEPEKFLTLFNFQRQQSQNVREEYWVPLEVKGKETGQTVGELSSASFKNLGGVFFEEIGTPVVTQRGSGTVKFSGSLVKGTSAVLDKVPEGCRLTAP
jgi:hypothetical protein